MPLQTAVHNFFVGRGGDMPAIHRLAMLNPEGDIDHILTQMDILKFIHDRCAGESAAHQTLEQSGAAPSHVQGSTIPSHALCSASAAASAMRVTCLRGMQD
jgi:hypothetical protein